jgi:hypothetical protein
MFVLKEGSAQDAADDGPQVILISSGDEATAVLLIRSDQETVYAGQLSMN